MFTALFFIVLLLSAVWHEYSHGWTANYLGDPTAKHLGRLTLNPIAHIDPMMTLLLPAMLILFKSPIVFAAAKPVPFNPYNLRYPKYGPAIVGAAGPLSNIALAIVFAVVARVAAPFADLTTLANPVTAALFIANLGVLANILLAVFNLVPIPPLDGSHVLISLLPPQYDHVVNLLQQYGMFILLILIIFFGGIISTIVSAVSGLLLGSANIVWF